MSAFGLEGAPYLFSQTGTFPAPYTFTVPATLEVRTDMASASFDGSGASGSWLPAVSFYSPSGVRLGTFPCQGTPLAMGDSAEVTWFPLGLAASSAAAPGGGIQFDTDNEGGYLTVAANNAQPFSNPPFYGHSTSLELMDTDNGMFIHADAGSGVAIGAYSSTPPSPAINPGGGGLQFESQHGGTTFLADEWSVTSASDISGFADTNIEFDANHDLSMSGQHSVNIQSNGDATIGADGGIAILASLAGVNNNIIELSINGGGQLRLGDDGSTSLSGGGLLSLSVLGAADLACRLGAASTFTVYNSTGNPVFRVNENGDLQGLTGKALTFNL